jgi:hypothetical protein
MAVKFAASLVPSNYVKPFAIEEADAKKLGAHYFALTSDPE